MTVHDQRALEDEPFGKNEARAVLHDRRDGGGRRKGRGVGARRLDEDGGARRRNQPADDAFAIIGLQAIDPRGLVREPVPDGEQEAGDDMKRALGQLGQGSDLGLPRPPKFSELASRQCERSKASMVTTSAWVGRSSRTRG